MYIFNKCLAFPLASRAKSKFIMRSLSVTMMLIFVTVAKAQLPYVESYTSPLGLFPYPTQYNGVRSGNDVYTYTAASTATFSNSSTAAAVPNVEELANGISNSSAANFFAVTTTGGDQKLLLSFFRRAQALEVRTSTWGNQNIVVGFELTQVEQSAVDNVVFYLQVFDGSGFVTVPGFSYETTGVTTLTSTIFTATLPGVANNQQNLRLRILGIPTAQITNYVSVAVDNLIISGTPFAQSWSNPTAQSLDYTQNFGSSDIFPYPTGIQGVRGGSITDYPMNLTKASASIFSNRNTQADFDSLGVISNLSIVGSDISALTSTNNNSKILFSPFARALGVVSAINTVGKSLIKVSYRVQFTKNGAGKPNDTMLTLALEYRVGTTTGFAHVPAGMFTTSGLSRGASQNFSEISLPSEVEDKPYVQLRWLVFANYPIPSGRSYSLSIDDISVTGTGGALPPTKLVLASGAPTGNILINTPFDIVANVINDASALTSVSGAT